jgi:N-ethylmaleimide reductase
VHSARDRYLHVVEDPIPASQNGSFFHRLRSAWKGIYVANGGYNAERGERALSEGTADAVAYGRLFLANPDLPKRLSRRGPLNTPDVGSFYGGDERGYIDYPEWANSRT